jgi:hypothetical protein
VQQDTTGALSSQTGATRTFTLSVPGPQATLTLSFPNALLSGPQSQDSNFVRTTIADLAGRVVSSSEPDTGETQFLYDPCGRVRFVQPALDPGEVGFVYNKYDAIGRIIEHGTVPQAWNPSLLSTYAADPSWPGPTESPAITYSFSFDGDGSEATAIGMKTACVTTTAAPARGTPCVSTEAYTYDSSGRLQTVSITAADLHRSRQSRATGTTTLTK